MDIWGLASAVSDAVKKSTAELSDTLRNTEWRSEFDEIRKEIEDDTSGIAKNAKAITEDLNKKTLHALQHVQGSGSIDPFARENQDEAKESKDKGEAKTHMKDEIGSRMQEMGQKFLSSTNGLYGKFSSVLQNELGVSFKGGKGKREPATKFEKFNRFNVEIATLQREAATYCNDPEDTLYSEWKDGSFSLEKYEDQISPLLEENTYVRENYNRLVPEEVDEQLFWSRYFFKLHALKEKQAIVMKLAMAGDQNAETEQVGWEEEDAFEEASTEEVAGMAKQEFQGDLGDRIDIHTTASKQNEASAVEKGVVRPEDTSGIDKDVANKEEEVNNMQVDDANGGDEEVASSLSNSNHECEAEIETLTRDADCIQIDTSAKQNRRKSNEDSKIDILGSSKSSEGKEDESWTKTGSNVGDSEEEWGDVADWE